MTLRLVIYAVAAALVAWVGWTVNGWRGDAAKLASVQKDLATERSIRAAAERRRQESDDARVLLDAQLAEFQDRAKNEIDILRKRVPVVVNNSPDCALGADAIRLLNDAIGGGGAMPVPSGGAAAASASAGSPAR